MLPKARRELSVCAMFIVLLLAGSLPPEALAQAVQAVWGARYDGPPMEAADGAHSTVVDSAGNIYVTGAATTRGGFSSFFDAAMSTRSDWITVKYDPAGNELWEARYEGLGGYSQETHLIVDSAGNVYVSMASSNVGHGAPDYCVIVKYDPAGNELWVARYADQAYMSVDALAVDVVGNVYITGSAYRADSSFDPFLIKYDPAGNRLWVVHLADQNFGMAVDNTGNVYVTGTDFLTGSTTVKYDPQGLELWTAGYNGEAFALTLDGANNVYVTGSIRAENDDDYGTVKYDSEGNETWTAIYDGPDHAADRAYHLVVDSTGNVYVTGYSKDGNSLSIYATIKYDPAGSQLWEARYDGSGLYYDYPQALAVDSAGNVCVLGTSTGSNGRDYATIKYDSAGTELWVAVHDGPGHGDDNALSMALDPAGNTVVTGQASVGSGYNFEMDYGTIKYDADGNQLWAVYKNNMVAGQDQAADMIIDEADNVYVTGPSGTVKYDAQGNQSWAASDGGDYQDPSSNLLAVDTGGNVYVANTEKGTLKYDPEGELLWAVPDNGRSLVLDHLDHVYVVGNAERPGTGRDFEIRKYDSQGNILWTVWYNGPGNGNDYAGLIDVDSTGNIYIAGQSDEEFAAVKYDPEGNELWVARYDGGPGGSGGDSPKALAVDNAGYVHVTGTSYGTGYCHYATVKYDPAGNELWAAPYSGPQDLGDYPRDIAVDSAGNVYVTGNSVTYINLLSRELSDYATVKYDSAGNQLWVARYSGPLPHPENDEIVTGVAVDHSGNVYVTGSTMWFLQPGNYDYATVKYDSQGNEIWAATYDGSGTTYDKAASLALDSLGNVYVTGFSNAAATALDFLTIKYSEVTGWAPAATMPGTVPGSAHVDLSRALGWVFSLSMPLLALAICRRAWKKSGHAETKRHRI